MSACILSEESRNNLPRADVWVRPENPLRRFGNRYSYEENTKKNEGVLARRSIAFDGGIDRRSVADPIIHEQRAERFVWKQGYDSCIRALTGGD